MASVRLRFIKSYVDRHGRPRNYFRKPGMKSVALPGAIGSAEFLAAYQEALSVASPANDIAARHTRAGTISAVIVSYLGSARFLKLKLVSQKSYRGILEGLRRDCGHLLAAGLERKHIVEILDDKVDTPIAARDFLRCL